MLVFAHQRVAGRCSNDSNPAISKYISHLEQMSTHTHVFTHQHTQTTSGISEDKMAVFTAEFRVRLLLLFFSLPHSFPIYTLFLTLILSHALTPAVQHEYILVYESRTIQVSTCMYGRPITPSVTLRTHAHTLTYTHTSTIPPHPPAPYPHHSSAPPPLC